MAALHPYKEVEGRLSREINGVRPTVDTLLLEAKVCREQKDFVRAIRLLSQAETWLGDPAGSGFRVVGNVGVR